MTYGVHIHVSTITMVHGASATPPIIWNDARRMPAEEADDIVESPVLRLQQERQEVAHYSRRKASSAAG